MFVREGINDAMHGTSNPNLILLSQVLHVKKGDEIVGNREGSHYIYEV